MAKVNGDQLTRTFNQGLLPVYLIAGDESLLVQEACDTFRKKARDSGYSERELYYTDAGFQWPQLLESANSLSLFADKKVIEIRLHNFTVGDAGKKVLQEYCERPPEDTLLLLVGPKLDKKTQNTAWCKAIDKAGMLVTCWPISDKQLPRWLDRRLKQAGLNADSQAIDILASKVEGNLLAAKQEIDKLKLLAPEGVINGAAMAAAVVDSARYDVFGLVDRCLSRDYRAATSTLNGLRAEGTEATLILWALSREVRALIKLKQSHGKNLEATARSLGIFPNRLPLIKSAYQGLKFGEMEYALRLCREADRAIKGMSKDNYWNLLLEVVLCLCGSRSLNPATQKQLTRH